MVGENMTMLGGKGEPGGGGGAPSGGGGGYASRGSAPSRGGGSSPADSFYDDTPGGIPDDDVPF